MIKLYYYIGIFYKETFLAFLSQYNYVKGKMSYKWTNNLNYAHITSFDEISIYYAENFIEDIKNYYNQSSGFEDLLSQDYDKKNGVLVSFLRPNFHNICVDQLNFKYLSKEDVRILKIKELM